jgi:geranylgeranyl reductase family protein
LSKRTTLLYDGIMSTSSPDELACDVLVVGGGPSGASCAYWLAMAGADVVLVEKKRFPRDKTCGDGLTPRAVVQLEAMGLGTFLQSQHRYVGLRAVAFGRSYELPWPAHPDYPDYGFVVRRAVLDQAVLERAAEVGADVRTHHEATGIELTNSAISAVQVRDLDNGHDLRIRARLTVLAEGSNARLARTLGARRDPAKPLGLAIRGYSPTPRADEPWIESHLDVRTPSGAVIPGYGWIFPAGDGTANVGFGILSSSERWKGINTTHALARFVETTRSSWHFEEEAFPSAPTGGKLPMGLSVQPVAGPNYLMVGDAASSINPFNGEGISYAYETGRMAAGAVLQALGSTDLAPIADFPTLLARTYGAYYALARGFVKLVSNPTLMSGGVWLAMRSKWTMVPVVAGMANLLPGQSAEALERIYGNLQRLRERIVGLARSA